MIRNEVESHTQNEHVFKVNNPREVMKKIHTVMSINLHTVNSHTNLYIFSFKACRNLFPKCMESFFVL